LLIIWAIIVTLQYWPLVIIYERREGSGYPYGITELDPIVEMIAVCDVYDALLSPRPYRPLSLDKRTALEELTRVANSGSLGRPCVEALVACNRIRHPGPDRVIVSHFCNAKGSPDRLPFL
jgi:HD-GYP domain-containing protein (c-di-GMP phosphodiesterase class II)